MGEAFEQIVQAGPALVLQEVGNLAPFAIALPLAVRVLGLRREAVGATFSIRSARAWLA